MLKEIEQLLGSEARMLLDHTCKGIPKESLHLPGPDFVDRVFVQSDRKPAVLRNLPQIYSTGRLAGTGYLSILPVDQGIEHSAGASFAPNPAYFNPENIVKLATAGGCNAVASTLGVLGSVARKYAHRIPFVLKINHNEFLSFPNTVRPDHVRRRGPGLRNGGGRHRRHDLLRLGGVQEADPGGEFISSETGKIRVPTLSHQEPASFGSLEVTQRSGTEQIGQKIDYSEANSTETAMITLDSLNLSRCDLIKIDVEGMELKVLEGASATIRQHHPVIHAEFIKTDKAALVRTLADHGYRTYDAGQNCLAIHESDPSLSHVESRTTS